MPKGRLFPTSRDDLIECVALLGSVRRGDLDAIVSNGAPLDVLTQQVVAETACREYTEDELFALVRGAWPFHDLDRRDFDAVVRMAAEGFATRRGRRGALIHRDEVQSRLLGRRGARLTALTSGGAIPEVADYRVILEPEDTFIGTLNEDFAIESMAGDVFQLGNASWRVLRVGPGTVRVADAKGAPPNLPFWLGEAPARTERTVAGRQRSSRRRQQAARIGPPLARSNGCRRRRDIPTAAAEQAVAYLAAGRQALGVIPTQDTLVLERFFDEAGGMQLVLHAPFGSRINKAWGLALRKRFCRQFNFELQAAATDEALLLVARTAALVPARGRLPVPASLDRPRPARSGGPRRPGIPDTLALEYDYLAGRSTQPRRQESAAAASAHARRRPDGGRVSRGRGVPREHPGRSRRFRIIRLSHKRCATACMRPWTSTGWRPCSIAFIAATCSSSRAIPRNRRRSRTRS